jgi:hypothetical protein
MNIWEIPQVRLAAEAILAAAQQVRLDHPKMTQRERIQEARARCVVDILAAVTAIELAELDASTKVVTDPKRATPWITDYHSKLRPSVEARREERQERIRKVARLHPDWTSRELAEYLGASLWKVQDSLQGTGIKMAGHKGGAPKGNQNGRHYGCVNGLSLLGVATPTKVLASVGLDDAGTCAAVGCCAWRYDHTQRS